MSTLPIRPPCTSTACKRAHVPVTRRLRVQPRDGAGRSWVARRSGCRRAAGAKKARLALCRVGGGGGACGAAKARRGGAGARAEGGREPRGVAIVSSWARHAGSGARDGVSARRAKRAGGVGGGAERRAGRARGAEGSVHRSLGAEGARGALHWLRSAARGAKEAGSARGASRCRAARAAKKARRSSAGPAAGGRRQTRGGAKRASRARCTSSGARERVRANRAQLRSINARGTRRASEARGGGGRRRRAVKGSRALDAGRVPDAIDIVPRVGVVYAPADAINIDCHGKGKAGSRWRAQGSVSQINAPAARPRADRASLCYAADDVGRLVGDEKGVVKGVVVDLMGAAEKSRVNERRQHAIGKHADSAAALDNINGRRCRVIGHAVRVLHGYAQRGAVSVQRAPIARNRSHRPVGVYAPHPIIDGVSDQEAVVGQHGNAPRSPKKRRRAEPVRKPC